MVEKDIEIKTNDGVTDAVLFFDAENKLPGVIHLTDIGGIRPSQRQMARQLAEKGYTVLMPNVFYRTSRPPVIQFDFYRADEQTRKQRIAELAGPLTPEAMESDAAAYVDFFAGQKSVKDGPMGVVGYCFTGSMAMRIAAVRPQKIMAAASFHGGRLYTDAPTSPHLLLPRIKAQLYFGHAENDGSMPADAIGKLDAALAAWGGKYESEVYKGAAHSWTVPDSPVYNPAQAEPAFQKLTALFSLTLKPRG